MDIFASTDSVRSAKPLLHAQKVTFPEPHRLERGDALPEITVVFETYGQLSPRKDNAILICHALSGDSHVASHDPDDDPGWWEIAVGPGKVLDTDKYFIICPNSLGGCRGTTGPNCINPRTGQIYGIDFPTITIGDIVEVQRMLIDSLGIDRLLAVIGGSLGGLMTLVWATQFPDRLQGAVAIATSARLTSQALAFDIVARNAILNDPQFCDGRYYEHGTIPAVGLAIARMLGHITYLSIESMRQKFDATRNMPRSVESTFETKFAVGSYLAHQGDKFVERFDANSYLTLSMAMDLFDLGDTPEKLLTSLRRSMCRWLLVSYTSDWLFPSFQSQELVDALIAGGKRVSYCNVKSDCGHDAFLLPNELPVYGEMMRSFLANLDEHDPGKGAMEPAGFRHRIDYERILALIPRGATVLDLGCGRGGFLARLKQRGNRQVMGIELEERYVLSSIDRGIDVVQGDLNNGLAAFSDKQFDFVVLSKTLQTVFDVEHILDEMLRVGTRAIVSFPNLGYHQHIRRLGEEGKAPRTDPTPEHHWYNASDVRFLTLTDFEEFCEKKKIRIHQKIALDTQQGKEITDDPNRNADVMIVVMSLS
ncbi:MAG: homoserine O-acetyltransferase [Planctomycetaceae bacterium]|nr:homoserine O-acetyltransferase [Planctomycetaceae bacterium]